MLPPEWDIRLYDSTGKRMTLPRSLAESLHFELVEQGGYGTGTLSLLAPWELLPVNPTDAVMAMPSLKGNERVDIFLGDTLMYRGTARIPRAQVAIPERRQIDLFGLCSEMQTGTIVRRRYAYGSRVDISQVFTDLVQDSLIRSGRYPSLLTDIQTIGVDVQTLDTWNVPLTDAVSKLLNISPYSAIWGFETVLSGGVWTDRIYLRPRALSSDTPAVTVLPGQLKSFDFPGDATEVVNRLYITGGPAGQTNLCPNAGFEYPCAPDEAHANLLDDYSFEYSPTGPSPAYWTLLNNAWVQDYQHESLGDRGPAHSGSKWCGLDQYTEEAQQTKPIDYTRKLTASVYVRRGNSTTGATFNLLVEGLDASGTVVSTLTCFSSPADPAGTVPVGSTGTWVYATGAADASYYARATMAVDFTAHATVTQARIRLIGYSGTNNNDGVIVDDAGLWYDDAGGQSSWTSSSSNCPGAAVDWLHRVDAPDGTDATPPLRGGYCVKLSGNPGSGGYCEIRTEEWARVKFSAQTIYTVAAHLRSKAGSGLDVTARVGVRLYDSQNTLYADYNVDVSGLGSGGWFLVQRSTDTWTADLEAEVYVQNRGSVDLYVDCVGLYQGAMPEEIGGNVDTGGYVQAPAWTWWEAESYERQFDVTDSYLTLTTPDAGSSQTVYGVREASESVAGVTDQASAVAYAEGYFNAHALPAAQSPIELAGWETPVGFGGPVRVLSIGGIPSVNAVPARIRWDVGADVTCTVDGDNQFPDLAILLHELQSKVQAAGSQGGTSGGNSQHAGPGNAGGASGSGVPGGGISGTETFVANSQQNQVTLNAGVVTAWTQTEEVAAAPSNLYVSDGNNQLALSWTPPGSWTSFNVKRATVSGGPYVTIASGVTQTTVVDYNVTNGSTYYYVVTAVNAGGESVASSEASGTPGTGLPAAPTGVSATAQTGPYSVLIAWSAESGVSGYNVKRALVTGGPYTLISSGLHQLSFTDNDVSHGTTYYYVVTAKNQNGEGTASTEVNATA